LWSALGVWWALGLSSALFGAAHLIKPGADLMAVLGIIFAGGVPMAALYLLTSCAVPECRGISHADATFREALWDRFFTAAPRPRTPSELLYSDRMLRSKSSPAATI